MTIGTRWRGIVLPVQKREGGYFTTKYTLDVIQSSIRMILNTHKGERVFNPEFGSDLYKLLFEPNDVILQKLGNVYIVDALKRWEKRVTVLQSNITQDEHEMSISIRYFVNDLNQEDVFTFAIRKAA